MASPGVEKGIMQARALVAVSLAVGCGSPATPIAPPRLAPPVAAPPVATAPPPKDPLAAISPLDPDIKLGHLANGLTYYVMKHHKPEQRASLWLAVNAGSVLEDDDQRGLAHFVEHMAFNGTRRFPKQDIVNYIEKVGMSFGADVNAYTAFDQTVYMLTVPTDDRGVVMKGLDILRDWAGDVTFDPVEVDKERGVVLEEWRLGRGAWARVQDKQWPVVFQGSRYAERLPIGKPEIIRTAKPETLVRFYKDWYRPDQMAVIAVGDFEPADLEAAITERFGDLRAPARPRTRDVVPVPHQHPTAVTIATDVELPFTTVTVVDKLDRRSNATRGDYRRFLVERLYHAMLGQRFEELALDPASPFTFAGSFTASFARTSDLFERTAQAKDGHTADALAALYREIERVEKFGFTAGELERARRQLVSQAETAAREWAKAPSPDLCDEITRHFFAQEQMPGRASELAMTRELLPTVTLAELGQLAKTWGSERGRVISISAPATAKLPSEAEVLALAHAASATPVEPWQDTGADRPLIATPPAPGKVATVAVDDAIGVTTWTLGNGIKVVIKPTPFQNDEILFTGWQRGGTSVVADKDYEQARVADDVVAAMGTGELGPIALKQALAGKVVDVRVGFDELAEIASGSARPDDLETALQLLHLRLTAPRKDARAFAAWRDEQLEWVAHRKLVPEIQFNDAMTALETGNHLRRRPETPEMIGRVDPDRAIQIFRDRFADLGNFTFVFVGNVDLKTLQPLVETYLGSLPAHGRKARGRDVGIRYPTGKIEKTVHAGSEPKSRVRMTMSAPDAWSLDGERDARILSMVLHIRLREVLREDMGGVYGVAVWASIVREPTPRRVFSLAFGCDPDNVDKLRAAAFAEIGKLARDGAGADYLDKVREQLRRQHETDLKENAWWLNQLRATYYYGDRFAARTDVDAMLARVTSANVKAAAKRFFDPAHYVLGVLRPVPAAK